MENLRKCQGKSLPQSSRGQAQVVSMFFKAGANGGVLSTQIRNWSSGLPTLRAGPQFRNPKHETNTKSEFSNVQNVTSRKDLSAVSVIWILEIRICFGFRYSDFGFTLDMCLCGAYSIRPPQGGYLQMQLTISRPVELAKEYSLPGSQNQTGARHKYGLG